MIRDYRYLLVFKYKMIYQCISFCKFNTADPGKKINSAGLLSEIKELYPRKVGFFKLIKTFCGNPKFIQGCN
jgi:hypothetical protein